MTTGGEAYEVNFDGMVGPTHNYSGLSYGNLASTNNQYLPSNPKAAALQGLEKMIFLHRIGFKQAVIPPQERPNIRILKQLGFTGTQSEIVANVSKNFPELFISCCSAASMWTANAATISPSSDSLNSRLHITPANLNSKFHRSFEYQTSSKILKAIFPEDFFEHHSPLPYFPDEGAANHVRFCKEYGTAGIQMFVFGKKNLGKLEHNSLHFPARQSYEASEAISRLHLLPKDKLIFAQQNPQAIDAGVFHNDVISIGNKNLFFYHELAFVETEKVVAEIRSKMELHCECDLYELKVDEKSVPLNDAVTSYLFNSQILSNDKEMILLAPLECQEIPSVKNFLEALIKQKNCPIKQIHYINLKESMQNGGGPACLRLRVILNKTELKQINPSVLINEDLYKTLVNWVNKYYRDKLVLADLADPQLIKVSSEALDALTKILGLGNIYSFQ